MKQTWSRKTGKLHETSYNFWSLKLVLHGKKLLALMACLTLSLGIAMAQDTDGDGIEDSKDNCKYTANADQADIDQDGIGDVCDFNNDPDGFFNQSCAYKYVKPPHYYNGGEDFNNNNSLFIFTEFDEANFTVSLTNGTKVFEGKISRDEPITIPLTRTTSQTNTINQPEADKGLIIESDVQITPVYILNAKFNRSLTTIGNIFDVAGTNFVAASMTVGVNSNPEAEQPHYISVVALEDNTKVTFQKNGFSIENAGGDINLTNGHTIELNENESVMLRTPIGNGASMAGVSIVSNNQIVVNSGSVHTIVSASTCKDGGIVNLLPANLRGKQFAMVKADLFENVEESVVVAIEDNTEVKVNGTAVGTIDRGEYYTHVLTGNPGDITQVETSKGAQVYHTSGVGGGCEVGFTNLTPLELCSGNKSVAFSRVGEDINVLTLTIATTGLSSLTFKGKPYTDFTTAKQIGSTKYSSVIFDDDDISPSGVVDIIKSDEAFSIALGSGNEDSGGLYGNLTKSTIGIEVYNPDNPSEIIIDSYTIGRVNNGGTIRHTMVAKSECGGDVSIYFVNKGIITTSNGGTISDVDGLSFTYTAPLNFEGEDAFPVILIDKNGLRRQVCIKVIVTCKSAVEPVGNMCISGDTIRLKADPDGGIWSGDGVTPDGLFDPKKAGPGSHIITYSFKGYCPDSLVINILDLVVAEGPNTEVCASADVVQLKGTPTGGIWSGTGVTPDGEFDPKKAGPGSHKITYSLDGYCPDTITLEVNELVSVEALGADVCIEADPIQLEANPDGGEWTGNGVTKDGLFDPKKAGAGSHYLVYSLRGYCPDSIVVDVKDIQETHIKNPGVLCGELDPIVLEATPGGGIWKGTGIDSITGKFDPVNAGTGTHVIKYQLQGACRESDSTAIIVKVESFKSNADIKIPEPCSYNNTDLEIELTYTGDGTDSLIINWDDGTVDIITDQDKIYEKMKHLYTEEGEYEIILKAYDNVCDGDNTIKIPFIHKAAMKGIIPDAPNVFTPNNDGINEEFKLFDRKRMEYNVYQDILEYEVYIYNRWGNKILYSYAFDPQNEDEIIHWDGKLKNGNPVTDGVYFYMINYRVKCYDDGDTSKVRNLVGHVSIQR